MKRFALLILIFFTTGPTASGTEANNIDPSAGSVSIPSQIDFTATLSINAIQHRLRESTASALRSSPLAAVTGDESGVKVTVTPRVIADRLSLSSRKDGLLRVNIPVDITVKVRKSGLANMIGVVGCKATSFVISAYFQPEFTSTGELQFLLSSVDLNNNNYQCSLKLIVEVDNIAARIRASLTKFGTSALRSRLGEFNALMPRLDELSSLLSRPAKFGGAVTLGLDRPTVQLKHVSSNDDSYRISGVIVGRPRLLFGNQWTEQTDETLDAASSVASDGFRLPARLLFPTDTALLPDANQKRGSGCLGSFRLQPVPKRLDLAVLQRCGSGAGVNVIWLSGKAENPPANVRVFNRRMSNVLDEILYWLDDRSLWKGVEGVGSLQREVGEFSKLLSVFEQETTIPLDSRGNIRFNNLNIELLRIWVNDEAIQADVILTGNAQIDIQLTW